MNFTLKNFYKSPFINKKWIRKSVIDNLTNQLSDRSKIIFNSAYKLADKSSEVFSSNHILFVILDDLEKYIKDFLIKLNPNISFIKNQISLLLKKYNSSSQYEKADKSVIKILKTSKKLMKEFGDKIVTQELLLLSFTLMSDEGKDILSNYNITFSKLQNEIKKFSKVQNAMNENAE